jgi:nicotinate-nucleotide adenylyltransferase
MATGRRGHKRSVRTNPFFIGTENLPASATRLPACAPGVRIGLLGGSFNPPHAAHLAISLFAMKRLGLDGVWWLVSPGNPLKDTSRLPPLAARLAAARRLARHPRIAVTGLEAVINARYSVETIAWLRQRCPGVHFVWIVGADILGEFHRWRNWRRIAAMLPIAVVDRGGVGSAPGLAFTALSRARVPESAAATLATRTPPAWAFLHGLKLPTSSTALRALTRGTGGG